ncbi:hypothetical protein [Chondrinema litorale]|uniref:hypothetical protein n=1 Tax=Chondrinema litorale TaxID=2994555 RepID=UPI002543E7A7|nr:hypothetical protein [Chondrinema litorale]UZR94030.1 hypothetical protein OQ292_19495 [Chondrinema litorale]
MRNLFFLTILMISFTCVKAQAVKDFSLAGFYNRTIDYYSSRLIENNKDLNQIENIHFLIVDKAVKDSSIVNPVRNELQTDFGNFTIEYLSEQELIDKLTKKKRDFTSYHFINYKQITQDTIDINISNTSITVKRIFKLRRGSLITKEINYTLSCGGTNGYIPTARFIYSQEKANWDFYTYDELLQSILDERRKMWSVNRSR